ncbi:MAG: HEAT repeat domain-containing protein, partial [Gemmatimonadales bacterium]
MNRRNSTPSPRRTAACLLLAAAGILMFLPACDRAEREPSPPVLEPDVRGGDGLHESEEMARILELQLRRDGPGLAEALEDPAPEVRARAAFALASVQDEGARQALERRLDDPEPRVRRDVVFALGQLPLESSEPLLLELFRTEEDPGVRERVLEALGKGGGPEAARALVELEPEEDRLAAARALAISRRALALSTV